MEQEGKNIIIAHSLNDLGSAAFSDYLVHALCIDGKCRILYNGAEHVMQKGDLMIVRKGKLVERCYPDSSFRVTTIYISSKFISLSAPQSNYGTKGQMALFLNPIMHLDDVQYERCKRDFDSLQERVMQTNHHFYHDIMISQVQALILDFFDFHASLYQEQDISTRYAAIMNRFIDLLESGAYRSHREVTWYADQLCVTSKYLSEVSKSVSGYAANFWINRYTALDISRLLRNKDYSFVQISDLFNFSSPAYFSRYVLHNLGVNPTNYRG